MKKEDPIKKATEEMKKLLEEKAKGQEKPVAKKSDPDFSGAMSELEKLAEQSQSKETEILKKKKMIAAMIAKRVALEEAAKSAEQKSTEAKSAEQKILQEALTKLDGKKLTENPEPTSSMDRYVNSLRDDRKKEEPIKEGLLDNSDDPVTQKQFATANKQTMTRIQQALASVGGGGLGKIEQGVTGTPADGQLPMYDAATNDMVWATVAGVGPDSGQGLDSSAILDLLGVDSGDTFITIENLDSYIYGDSDVIDLLKGSGVQNIMPQLDSTYDLGDSARRWKDLWLSGNTIHLGDVAVSSRGNDGVGVYANGRRLAYHDSIGSDSSQFYTTADHDSDTKVYLNTDSYALLDTTKQLRYSNVYATEGDLPDATTYHGMFAHVHATGAGYFAHAGNWIQLANISDLPDSGYTTADHDSDTLVQVDSAYVRARVKTDQNLSTTDIVTFDQVYANLDGAIEFKANNRSGATILKGQPVYIDGVDGNKPTIALADASDPSKMPAYGLLLEDANDNADAIVVTFGSLKDVDTSAFSLGDTLYIGTSPGTLVTTPPAGTNSLIQNIGRVIRSHGSTGSIKVGGAGRTNATPNLSAGQIFYGNDSDRAVPTLATDVFDSDYINSLVDNPFLYELQDVQIDSTTLAADEFLQWNGSVWTNRPLTIETSLTFKGSIDVTTDSAPSGAPGGALYVNTGNGTALASWNGVAGDNFVVGQSLAWSDSDSQWYQMGVTTSGSILEVQAGTGITVDNTDTERPVVSINRAVTDQFYLDSAEGIILIDERIPVIVDSAYVQLRQDHYTRSEFESDALDFVDSNYINARAGFYTTAKHDSDTLVQVDSAYVQARVTFPVDSVGLDSTQVLALITSTVDSAYVAARDSDILATAYTTADHDSDTLVQVDSAYINARVDASNISITDSLPEGTTNLYYTTARHDSDTLIQVDSAYVIRHADSHFVNAAGDSMTGKLFAPAIQITKNPDDSDRSVLTFTASGDSTHDLEFISAVPGDFVPTGYPSPNERNPWHGIVYDGSGTWVMMSYSGTGRLAYSTDRGINWTTVNGFDNMTWFNLSYINGLFVASALQGTIGQSRVISSPDGINWTTHGNSYPLGAGMWSEVFYIGGKYVTIVDGIGSVNSGVYTSTDLSTWTKSTVTVGGTTYDVNLYFIRGPGKLYALTDPSSSSSTMISTTDGVTWTLEASSTNLPSYSGGLGVKIKYGNGKMVAAYDNTTVVGRIRVADMSDLSTWTTVMTELLTVSPFDEKNIWTGLAYGGGRWVATGYNNRAGILITNKVMYSTDDAVTWTAIPSSNDYSQWEDVEYGAGKFIAVAHFDPTLDANQVGANKIMIMEDDGSPASLQFDNVRLLNELDSAWAKSIVLEVLSDQGLI